MHGLFIKNKYVHTCPSAMNIVSIAGGGDAMTANALLCGHGVEQRLSQLAISPILQRVSRFLFCKRNGTLMRIFCMLIIDSRVKDWKLITCIYLR